MPEFRTDWLTGRSVIVAEGRAGRPNEFATTARPHAPSSPAPDEPDRAVFVCPFCPGQESRTPPAVYERLDEQGRWQVRVVPNKFPALTLDDIPPLSLGEGTSQQPAVGVHEVVIESARHVDRTSAMSLPEFQEVLAAYGERLRHWHDDGRFRYGLVLKNVGPDAGASLSHVHSQLIALTELPPTVARELRRAEESFSHGRTCPYCHWIEQERIVGERIVFERDGYIAFCPSASLQPYEVWLLPVEHQPWFERDEGFGGPERLANLLHELLRHMEVEISVPGYNFLLQTAPWIDAVADWCHWRIEVIPRTTALAALEIATGVHINPVAPERAAREMRESGLFAGARSGI